MFLDKQGLAYSLLTSGGNVTFSNSKLHWLLKFFLTFTVSLAFFSWCFFYSSAVSSFCVVSFFLELFPWRFFFSLLSFYPAYQQSYYISFSTFLFSLSYLLISRTCCLPCILFLSFLPYLINSTSSFFFCVFHLFLRVLCSESCIRFFNVSAIFTTSIWVSIANFFKLLLLLLGVTMTNVLDFLTKLNRQEEWWKNRISIHN